MLIAEIIRQKRDGEVLPDAEIDHFIAGLTDGSVSEGQAAAFAMAVFFRGMEERECAAFTRAMARSGRVLDWSNASLDGPILDKHSTGGVGDNVSLMLAPALAACGAFVPMISGRGLGHTGGTLDKLESIPGYRAQPDDSTFTHTVRQAGCAIIGQTQSLAPADRRLYAIRDVTATVESIPLITASILSKKLAAGLQGLVMDVKCGSGAFMVSLDDANALAANIARVATAAGLPTVSLVTDMDEPLASCAGNAIEVRHAIDYLTGTRREPRVHEVILSLGEELLVLGGLHADRGSARAAMQRSIESGAAADRFARMVELLGGPADLLEHARDYLAIAPASPVLAPRDGFVTAIDTRALGMAVVTLGGGRSNPGDRIDPTVGLSDFAQIGAHIQTGEPLCFIYAADAGAIERVATAIRDAFRIEPTPAAVRPIVLSRN